jgi:hypothetical protein
MGTGTAATPGIYDDRSLQIAYTGTWGQNTDNGRYLGTQTFSNVAGDTASFTFDGTQVAYVYETQSNLGHVQVSIDDTVVTSDLDECSPTLQAQQRVLYTGLSDGAHTITVKILGYSDSSSSNTYGIVDAFLVGPAATAYDDTDPNVVYAGGWGHNTDTGRFLGTQSFSNRAGDSASLAFTGTHVTYVYEAQSNMGHAQISIDGAVITPDLDEYSATSLPQQRLVYSGLSAGPHTITITNLGTQDAAASNSYIIVDAFLLGAPSSGSFDDTDPTISYVGTWGQNTDVGRFQGTQSFSNISGNTASFTFFGAQIAYVYEAQSNMGHAQISIDGLVVTPDVDEYSSTLKAQQQLLYSGLSSGQHTIQVAVLGSKDPASSNSYVIVDAFVVPPVGDGIYDDVDPVVSYTGTWGHNSDYNRYDGTQSFSDNAGDSASFTFNGTQVAYVYDAQPNLGHVQVRIDGTIVTADLDEYSALLNAQLRMIYPGLSSGTHTITVTILGAKDAAATDSYGTVDAFIVGSEATVYDDSSPQITYSGSWNSNSDVGRYMGTQTFSNLGGSQSTLTFTGTGVTYVYDAQSNMGYATISIDGTIVTPALDEYSPTLLPQQQFVYSGLSPGTHTITVTPLGTNDVGSSNHYVIVDAFFVTP